MIYQDRKIKQMLRSILPSKGRKGARKGKTASKRTSRHNITNALHNYKGYVLDDDDDSELVMQIHREDGYQADEIREIVRDRRDADKINHFVRWAENVTGEFDDARDKRERFISLIGGNTDLIRDHAIGHFISPGELNPINKYFSQKKDVPTILVTREQFTEAMNRALDTFTLESLDDIISPQRDDGTRYYSHRWRRCTAGKHACMVETIQRTACITHVTLPDGSRDARRYYPWIDITGMSPARIALSIPAGAAYYIRESKKVEHNSRICRNIVALKEDKQAKNVIHFIFSKRKSMMLHDRYYQNRGRRNLAKKFYDFFLEENLWA